MGMSIHYWLQSQARTATEASQQIGRLQQAARRLPFGEVGDVVELAGDEIDVRPGDDPVRSWLVTQAGRWLTLGEGYTHVVPQQLIAFTVCPGPGCESANFGLCRYPATVTEKGRRMATGLSGWSWQSFCKTQYASNPTDGGIENFLRCHLALVRLLDQAQDLNLLERVQDESGYWDDRDVEALKRIVCEWNRHLAAFVGQFKDQHGGAVVAPIADYPDFEHLEAEGRNVDDA